MLVILSRLLTQIMTDKISLLVLIIIRHHRHLRRPRDNSSSPDNEWFAISVPC